MDYERKIALQSQRTPTPHNIKVNNCKLIDLVIRIVVTRAILMPRFDNPFPHVFIFGIVFPESQFCFYACYKLYQRYMFQFIPIELVQGDEIVRNRRATKPWLGKHVTKYKNMLKNWWSNFSKNLRIVTLKLLKLIRFLSPYLSIYSYLL